MTRDELQACWKDRRNHRWGFYCCRADPRVIVPRGRRWMGWTMNAARPAAVPVVLLLVGMIVGPWWILEARGAGPGVRFAVGALSIAGVCRVCAWLSSRTG